MCRNLYIYSAHTLAHTKPFGRQFLGKHIYICCAYPRAYPRANVHKSTYIYSAHTLAHTHFAQACFSRPLGGNRFAGYAIPLGRAYPAHTQSVSAKAWRAHWLLSGPGKEKETKPGNRARRWGTLENKVPEEGWRIHFRTPEIEHAVGDR